MITTNTGAKKIEGTDNWREIFDAHNDSVNAHDKVSEAMTYVVNGNKSIENAAIPVGSYVRLANSTIVGRSDGIYTVKTAIPVNTVIDSSYFNENAPIPGGVANALNSKLTKQVVYKQIPMTISTESGYQNINNLLPVDSSDIQNYYWCILPTYDSVFSYGLVWSIQNTGTNINVLWKNAPTVTNTFKLIVVGYLIPT